MVRQRSKSSRHSECDTPRGGAGGDARGVRKPGKRSTAKAGSQWSAFAYMFVGGLAIGVCAFLGYRGYLETRVSRPFSAPLVTQNSGLAVPGRFWGSYRPGVYFGLKTRSPRDVLAGLMWFIPEQVKPANLGLRHWCEQGDDLDSYGWLQHDGETFGIQEIKDRDVKLTTSFIKKPGGRNGGDWTARIRVEPNPKIVEKKGPAPSISLFFYVGLDEGADGGFQWSVSDSDPKQINQIRGHTETLGHFKMKFKENGKTKNHFYTALESVGPHQYTDDVMRALRLYHQTTIGLNSETTSPKDNINLVVHQVTATLPFEMDVVFESESSKDTKELSEANYDELLNQHIDAFNKRFEETFRLQEKGYKQDEIDFAQAALSNMMGGIGYFYGHSLVKSDLNPAPVKYWDAPLYTGVPSRSFFPRGFLWDEGFHNLLISKWSGEISSDILGHWMDLINVEGWIPREQILGLEARAKVPAEFIVQHNKNANPPTLLLTLHSMVSDNRLTLSPWFKDYLQRMWTRLEVWFDWFNNSQAGEIPGTYRWRGRNGTTNRELNPKTLTSGLDDYPRASHPSPDERHIDLRCWIALAARLMADIAKVIGRQESQIKYSHLAEFLYDNSLLDSMHWSVDHGAYLDFGLHTENVHLERPRRDPRAPPGAPQPEKVRVVSKEPNLQFVNQVGYVSLFPFLLQILSPTSPHLDKILDDLIDPEKLYTPFGIRSLSKEASLYMKHNTEHDKPYWRGPIWININFLAVRALHHYANVDGPRKVKAKEVYTKLRSGVISNVIKEYKRTGYIWEQYNDKTGKGQGCRPFTGWSSLVVLMMGETY